MFFAALMSRSCRVRQAGHVQCLVFRLSSASRYPHELHVLELGYQRSTGITRRPARAALYSIMRRKVVGLMEAGSVPGQVHEGQRRAGLGQEQLAVAVAEPG